MVTLINLASTGAISLDLNSSLPSFLGLPYIPPRLLPAIPTVLTALTSYSMDNFPEPGEYEGDIVFAAEAAQDTKEVRSLDVGISAIAGRPDPFQSKAISAPTDEFPANTLVPVRILIHDTMGNDVSEAALDRAGIDGLSFLRVWKQYGTGEREEVGSLNYDGKKFAYREVEVTQMGLVEIHMEIDKIPIGSSPIIYKIKEARCDRDHEQRTKDRMDCECVPGYWRDRITRLCRPCAAGFFKGPNDESCSVCPANTFSFPGASTCNTCPEEAATCTEGIIRFKPGYWWNPKYDASEVDDKIRFHRCPNPETCHVKNGTVNCSGGHTHV
eukprot:gb/GECG01001792.1/.p1 GENE.gb/GECG01001792.1/~~gb/GECG01001792.1/.p1  ORF type:complete len:328 (+),score=22.56 gb/GECG01001792.1/:1-984(+)